MRYFTKNHPFNRSKAFLLDRILRKTSSLWRTYKFVNAMSFKLFLHCGRSPNLPGGNNRDQWSIRTNPLCRLCITAFYTSNLQLICTIAGECQVFLSFPCRIFQNSGINISRQIKLLCMCSRVKYNLVHKDARSRNDFKDSYPSFFDLPFIFWLAFVRSLLATVSDWTFSSSSFTLPSGPPGLLEGAAPWVSGEASCN